MDNLSDNHEVGSNDAAQPFSVGATLREAREQMGLSVVDVANRIKFAPRQIEAMEADDFAHLPEATFVRGFVRSYARLLGMEATPLLAALPQSHLQSAATLEKKSVEVPFPSVLTARRSNIAWLAGALLVALALIVFSRMHDSPPSSTQSVAQTNVETLELPAAALAAASAPVAEAVPAEQIAATPLASKPAAVAPVAEVKPQTVQGNDKAAKESRAQEKLIKEQPAIDKAAKKKAAQELAAQEQAAKEQAALERKEQAALERAARKQAAQEKAAQEAMAKEKLAQERAAKMKAAQEQAALERAAKKQAAQEKAAQDAMAKEKAAQERAAKKQAAAELAAKTPKPADVAAGLASMRLVFDEDSWVDVKDANGKLLLSKMNHAGSLVRISGAAPLSIVIGHASGVHLFYKGKEVNLAPHTSVEVARLLLE